MLTDNSRQWRKIVQGLKQWEEDEVITDYISNPVLNLIEAIENGNVTVETVRNCIENRVCKAGY